MDGEDAQAVIQVRPELPLVEPRRQVAVSRRDQPHVGADHLVAPDALERLLLEHAQHLGLGGRRHVADLVEEEGAAVALLELADATAVGAGEGALLVAEQLALQQVLRDGGAVEGQERCPGAGAMLVDGAGDQFLAGATLPRNQHGKGLVGDTADGLVRFLHPRAGADDGFAGEFFVRRRLRDHGWLAHQAGDLQGLADYPVQFLHIERFEQVVVSPVPHRLDGRVGRPDHGDKHDRDAGVNGADLVQDLQARLVRQAQVEENDIRGRRPNALEALATRVGDLDSVFGGGEAVADLLREQVRVIIDQQQVGHGWRPPGRSGLVREADAGVRAIDRVITRGSRYRVTIWIFGLPFGILFAPRLVGTESSRRASFLFALRVRLPCATYHRCGG